jgi:Cu/Ag efflux protein CusF
MGNMPGIGNLQPANINSNNSGMNHYAATGVVESIASDRTKATIHHQAIPGYMMEMTMDYSVKDTNQFNGISPGDQIIFQLVEATNQAWIESVKRTGQSAPAMTNSMPPMGGM